jgi:hypothetical protein
MPHDPCLPQDPNWTSSVPQGDVWGPYSRPLRCYNAYEAARIVEEATQLLESTQTSWLGSFANDDEATAYLNTLSSPGVVGVTRYYNSTFNGMRMWNGAGWTPVGGDMLKEDNLSGVDPDEARINIDAQKHSAILDELSDITITPNGFLTFDLDGRLATFGVSDFTRGLMVSADAPEYRSSLGLGTAAVSDVLDEDGMDSDSSIHAPSQSSVKSYVTNSINGYSGLKSENNLSDLTSVEDARDNMGLGTASTLDAPDNSDLTILDEDVAKRKNVVSFVEGQKFTRAFDTKANFAAFPLDDPEDTVIVDSKIYRYNAGGNPGHDGYALDSSGRFYVLRRPPIIDLEAFRSDIDFNGIMDSTAGVAKALGMASAMGGAKILFPRQALLRAKIADVPDNTEIDFNWSKLVAPNLSDTSIVSMQGSLSANTYSLFADAQQGDVLIKISAPVDFVVGEWIWVYDASSRLSDGAVDINNSLRQVVGMNNVGGVIDVVLDMPLSFKKTVAATGRRNVVKVNFGKNRRLFNLETAPPEGTTGGGAGVFARWVRDSQIYGRVHTRGFNNANDIRACLRLNGGDTKSSDPQNPAHYHTGLIQGSRECHWSNGWDHGVRHSCDVDSADLCRAERWSSVGALSTPFIFAHNGNGGYGNYVEGEVFHGPNAVDGYGFFNTRGWYAVTGQGANETAYPILSPTVIMKGVVKRDGVNPATGVYFQQPVRDARIDVDLVNGDPRSYDPGPYAVGSSAVRLYQVGNTADVRIRRSLGFNVGLMFSSLTLSTDKRDIVSLQIDEIDYAKYAVYASNTPGLDIKKIAAGANITTKLIAVDNGGISALRYLGIKNIHSLAPADKLFAITGASITAATGEIGVIDTPDTFVTQSVSGNFTLTRESILNAGNNPKRIDATAAADVTVIEPGLVSGQRLALMSGTAGTFPVTVKTTTTNVQVAADRILNNFPLWFTWWGGFWREDRS